MDLSIYITAQILIVVEEKQKQGHLHLHNSTILNYCGGEAETGTSPST